MWIGTISGPRIDPGHSSFRSLEGRGGTSKEDRGTAARKVGGKSRNGKPWKPGEKAYLGAMFQPCQMLLIGKDCRWVLELAASG